MSRIVVHDMNNYPVGEFTGIVNRSWAIGDANSSSVLVPDETLATKDYIQLGRVVTIEHAKLPIWAGVIDAPINCEYPQKLTLHSIEYLLSQYGPSYKWLAAGTDTINAILSDVNSMQQDTFIRAGVLDNTAYEDPYGSQNYNIDQYWNQIKGIASVYGLDITFRPERASQKQLIVYIDAVKANDAGVYTGLLLHDGAGGNMDLNGFSISEPPINHVLAIPDISYYSPTEFYVAYRDDTESIAKYRKRSKVYKIELGDAWKMADLYNAANIKLAQYKLPKILINVSVLDVGDIFNHVRLGNSFSIRASNIIMPGGVRGWEGVARIKNMSYSETENKISLSLEAFLD